MKNSVHKISLLILITYLLMERVVGYSSGAPTSACFSMTPAPWAHGSPQTSVSSVKISAVGPNCYTAGTAFNLKLSGGTFKGFFIEPRPVPDGPNNLGKFTINANSLAFTKIIACGETDALTHNDGTSKTEIDFSWTPPAAAPAKINIRSTVVQAKTTFWINIDQIFSLCAATTLSPTTVQAATTAVPTTVHAATTIVPTTVLATTTVVPTTVHAATTVGLTTVHAATTVVPSTVRAATTVGLTTFHAPTTSDTPKSATIAAGSTAKAATSASAGATTKAATITATTINAGTTTKASTGFTTKEVTKAATTISAGTATKSATNKNTATNTDTESSVKFATTKDSRNTTVTTQKKNNSQKINLQIFLICFLFLVCVISY